MGVSDSLIDKYHNIEIQDEIESIKKTIEILRKRNFGNEIYGPIFKLELYTKELELLKRPI